MRLVEAQMPRRANHPLRDGSHLAEQQIADRLPTERGKKRIAAPRRARDMDRGLADGVDPGGDAIARMYVRRRPELHGTQPPVCTLWLGIPSRLGGRTF
jgi:hypothetical protein